MSMRNMERNILAVYDICDPRRLARVAKVMLGYGLRVQQSVFELNLDFNRLAELHDRVNSIIDASEDSVRYYILCADDWQKRRSIGVNVYDEPNWDADYFVV